MQKKQKSNTTVLFLFLLSLLFFSCRQQKFDDAISPAFKPVLERAVEMNDSGYTARSIRYIDSAAYALKPLSLRDQDEVYVFKYNIYMRDTRDLDKALAYADSMLWLFEKSDTKDRFQQLYAQAEYRKGDALFARQSYTTAYRYFYDAKVLQDKSDTCILSNYNYRMGMILYKQKHFDDAVVYFKDAFNQAGKCEAGFEVFYKMQELLDNIGLSYFNNNSNDSAIIFFKKALAFIDENRYRYIDKSDIIFDKARGIVYGNLATAYVKAGLVAEAESLFKKSIAISSRKGYDIIDGQLTRLKLTRLYYDDNDYDAAYPILQDIKKTLDSVPDRAVQAGWYNLMWQYYRKKGQTQLAFDYLLDYSNVKDSLDEENIMLRGIDVRGRIKNMDTEHEIYLLEKRGERRKYLLVFTVTASVMAIIILLLIMQNLKRSKKNVHVLTTLNSHIRDQNHRLEEVLTQLELSSKEKDRILRTVAHDIRNPIAAISTITGVLLENTDNYTAKQKEYLDLIETACKNALLLSNEILEATNVIRKEKLSKETFDVKTLITYCVDLSRFRAVEKYQEVLVSVDENVGDISADKEKISRTIGNLLVNAIKFSPEGSEIRVQAIRKDGSVIITVADNGIGIPEELRDKVFDMFSEAKRPGTAGEKPFGLGLSISRQIINAHGGRLWFEDNPEGGTIFYVQLPG